MSYVVPCLVWSLVGFLVGYCFARIQAYDCDPYLQGGRKKMVEGEGKKRRDGRAWQRALSVILIVLSLITVVRVVVYTECQNRVNKQLLQAHQDFRQEYKETWKRILHRNPPDRKANQDDFTRHINKLEDEPGPQPDDLESC